MPVIGESFMCIESDGLCPKSDWSDLSLMVEVAKLEQRLYGEFCCIVPWNKNLGLDLTTDNLRRKYFYRNFYRKYTHILQDIEINISDW